MAASCPAPGRVPLAVALGSLLSFVLRRRRNGSIGCSLRRQKLFEFCSEWMSLDGYLPPRTSSDRTFQRSTYHDESAGLRETAAPFHRSWRACYGPLVGSSCSTPIGDGSGPLSRRTRSSWREQMIVVGYGRISDREKRVTSAISTEHLVMSMARFMDSPFSETPICIRSTTAIIRPTLDESMRNFGQSLT
jgi:hypothetical protein